MVSTEHFQHAQKPCPPSSKHCYDSTLPSGGNPSSLSWQSPTYPPFHPHPPASKPDVCRALSSPGSSLDLRALCHFQPLMSLPCAPLHPTDPSASAFFSTRHLWFSKAVICSCPDTLPPTTPNFLVCVPVFESVMSSHGIERVSPGSSGVSLYLHLSPAPRGQLASQDVQCTEEEMQAGIFRKEEGRDRVGARLNLGHEYYVDIESRR